MAETDKKIEAMEQEVSEASANPQADAPKKNAVAAEPSHIAKMASHEDLGAAVVKPTDSNPDASKKINQVSGDAQQKNQGAADAMPKLKEGSKETEKTPEGKEDKAEAMHDKEKMKKDDVQGSAGWMLCILVGCNFRRKMTMCSVVQIECCAFLLVATKDEIV